MQTKCEICGRKIWAVEDDDETGYCAECAKKVFAQPILIPRDPSILSRNEVGTLDL